MLLAAGGLSAGVGEEPGEELRVVDLAGARGLQGGFEAVAGVLGERAEAGLAEVLELFAVAVPAVAVLVVLAGVLAGDLLAAGDTGDGLGLAPHRLYVRRAAT